MLSFGSALATPWLLGGEFNCVLRPCEKSGRAPTALASMFDFNSFVCAAGLCDAGFSGPQMTWSNNRVGLANVRARLDMVFLNNAWQVIMPNLLVKHLPRGPSDHAPLLLSLGPPNTGPSRFVYLKMWSTHDSFLQIVSKAWHEVHVDHPNALTRLSMKLKGVKYALWQWNKEVFGDVTANVKYVEVKVACAQETFDGDPSAHNRETLHVANALLCQALH